MLLTTIRYLKNSINSVCWPDDESFGKYVSKIIESKKITQAKLSDRTGVPKPTISRYLRDMEDNMKRVT